jgi:hypothetical protein
MFSRPAMQFIRDIDGPLGSLYQDELKRHIKPFKQGSGRDMGFFPRSVLLGFLLVGVPSLCLLSYGAIRVVSYAYRKYLVLKEE